MYEFSTDTPRSLAVPLLAAMLAAALAAALVVLLLAGREKRGSSRKDLYGTMSDPSTSPTTSAQSNPTRRDIAGAPAAFSCFIGAAFSPASVAAFGPAVANSIASAALNWELLDLPVSA
jgi:hypothetical protein